MTAHLRSLSVDVDRSPAAMLNYQVAKTIERSGGNPSGVLELLETVIRERSWEKVAYTGGKPFASFLEFVLASRAENGLGTTKETLLKLIQVPHEREETEWRERGLALRQAIKQLLGEEIPVANPVGRPSAEKVSATHISTTQASRDASAITARLKRDDPELAAKVISGEMSANAAAREKGWRKPRVVLTSPRRVAQKLREHFTVDQIAELITILSNDG